MSRRDHLLREAWRIVRFGIVGVMNTAIYTSAYAAFLALGFPYLDASVCAYIIAISIAYFLNHRFTFRVAEHSRGLVGRFFAVQIAGAVVNIALLALLIDHWGWDELVAQFVLLPPVVTATFIGNRFFVFRGHVDTALADPRHLAEVPGGEGPAGP
ncbi:MAG: GtrA family protein [Patulibacter minatonensis]